MHTIGRDDASTSTTAIALCLNSPIVWSMTPLQRTVLLELTNLQQDDSGQHSLLPNVMDALVELARRPWWDGGVAGIESEPDPRCPDPPVKPLVDIDPDPQVRADTDFWARYLAMHACLTKPVELSMTRAQDRVFNTLCDLQVADAGAASLLPHVLDELLAVARQPWWDHGVADIPDEIEPESGQPA